MPLCPIPVPLLLVPILWDSLRFEEKRSVWWAGEEAGSFPSGSLAAGEREREIASHVK